MIELKVRNIVGEVADAVAATAPGLSVYYASFLHSELLHATGNRIALIDGVPVSPTAFAVESHATHAGIAFNSLERNFVSQLQTAGIRVFTWTVDDPRDIAIARSLGVDGIISNFPDRLRD
jgi:glycerophosphoryl diester phosphodiesterase